MNRLKSNPPDGYPSTCHNTTLPEDAALLAAHAVIVNLDGPALAELLLSATADMGRDERTLTARLAAIALARLAGER